MSYTLLVVPTMVFGLSQKCMSVWAGTNGHLVPLQYTTSVLVLSAIWYYKENMHTAHGRRTQQSSHTHVGCCGGG